MTEITTDVICPFLIDSGLSRGQSVRLGESLDTIISQHAYPEPIGKLVAQAAVLTTLLASSPCPFARASRRRFSIPSESVPTV